MLSFLQLVLRYQRVDGMATLSWLPFTVHLDNLRPLTLFIPPARCDMWSAFRFGVVYISCRSLYTRIFYSQPEHLTDVLAVEQRSQNAATFTNTPIKGTTTVRSTASTTQSGNGSQQGRQR
jgi:hypothetical protein